MPAAPRGGGTSVRPLDAPGSGVGSAVGGGVAARRVGRRAIRSASSSAWRVSRTSGTSARPSSATDGYRSSTDLARQRAITAARAGGTSGGSGAGGSLTTCTTSSEKDSAWNGRRPATSS